jgi:hypothetical protein
VSRSGEIAVAHFNDYRIEVWDLSGTHLRTLEREAAWFPPGGEAGSPSADRQARPNAGLWTPRFDEHGRLWTFARVADGDWADALETGPDPYGRPRMGVPQGSQSDLYDSMIEVLDPATGRLLASTRIDAALGFLLPGGYAASYREDDGGNPFIDIWRMEVVEESAGGRSPGSLPEEGLIRRMTGWVSRAGRLRAPATAAHEGGRSGRAVEPPSVTWPTPLAGS